MDTVVSADGTRIAYDRVGTGPSLVLVHGGAHDRRVWGNVLPLLAEEATAYAFDRRGRGGSGDAVGHALDREVEDALAVIETVGEPVWLLGHSYGGIVALEAAFRTDRLRGLILYEPPISPGEDRVPDRMAERLQALLDAEGPEAMLITFAREVVRRTDEEIAAQRAEARWPERVAIAHTLPRELRVVNSYAFDRPRLAGLTLPTLLLEGGVSPSHLRAAIAALHAALPNSEQVTLEGQHHMAIDTAPRMFADAVQRFMRSHSAAGTRL